MSFGKYLKQLRTEKPISQRELAYKAGISNAEISRIETGGRQKPSPDVLRAIAPILGVPYEELMDKAGYLNSRASFVSEHREAEEKFIDIVTPQLIKEGWTLELCKDPGTAHITAKKEEVEWHIDFKFFRFREDSDKHFREDRIICDTVYRIYGRLAIYDQSALSKFTIAVHNNKVFERLLQYVPKHLTIHVSIMLIDFETNKIIQECILT